MNWPHSNETGLVLFFVVFRRLIVIAEQAQHDKDLIMQDYDISYTGYTDGIRSL